MKVQFFAATLTVLTLSASAFAEPASYVTSKAAAEKISDLIGSEEPVYGTLDNGKSCAMSVVEGKKASVVKIESEEGSVSVSLSLAKSKVRVSSGGTGSDFGSITTETYYLSAQKAELSYSQYEDMANFSITIKKDGKETSCSFRE